MEKETMPIAQFDPSKIECNVLKTQVSLQREHLISLDRAAAMMIWQHMIEYRMQDGHVVSLVQDKEGVQIYICCLGSWCLNRSDVADPYLLDIENPKELLAAICEYFSKIQA